MRDTSAISVGPKGRIVIPAQIRQRLGLKQGSELVALVQDDGVLLLPRQAIKQRLRRMFNGVETSMARELISERREAARKESRP